MLVRNEQFEMIDSAEFAKLIDVSNLKKDEYSEEDAEKALESILIESSFIVETDSDTKEQKRVDFIEFRKIDAKKLWGEVKKQFCKFAKTDTVIGELIKIIVEAIASVVILGVLVLKLVEIIVKYLIDKGVAVVCPV